MQVSQQAQDGAPALLQMRGICKSFGPVQVLHDIDLDLVPGEVVGLMGPNGAGKSTLIKVLAGIHSPDAGQVRLRGKQVDDLLGRPELGIIHQELGLIDSLSILDNVRLGAERLNLVGPLLNRAAEIKAAQGALHAVGLGHHSVFDLVGTLTAGEKAMLAIGRLLERGAEVIIVDETTASLPPSDAEWFIEKLHTAAARNTSVVMVSHKLGEIRSAADRLVLIVDGRITTDAPMDDPRFADNSAVEVLLGAEREEAQHQATERQSAQAGAVELEIRNAYHGPVGPVDLTLSRGVVLGLTGQVASGLHQMALMAAGFVRPESGDVLLPNDATRALVPPERENEGIFPDLPSVWNMTLSALPRWRSGAGLLQLRREADAAERMIERLAIVPRDRLIAIGALSGGNQQKILFARAMLQEPDVFVLCEPTRGVDLRTRREIYKLIEILRHEGCAVLIATSDVEDLLAVCDRVGVVDNGTITRTWEAGQFSTKDLAEIV